MDTPTDTSAPSFTHEDVVAAVQSLIGAFQGLDGDIEQLSNVLRLVASVVDHNITNGTLSLPEGWVQSENGDA